MFSSNSNQTKINQSKSNKLGIFIIIIVILVLCILSLISFHLTFFGQTKMLDNALNNPYNMHGKINDFIKEPEPQELYNQQKNNNNNNAIKQQNNEISKPNHSNKNENIKESLPKSSLKTDNILKNHFKEPIISSEIDMDKLFDFYRKSYWLNYVSVAKYVESKRWTFVITGDLHLMWLRDSSAQMHPYLYLSSMNDHIKDVLAGMLRMQAFYFHSDPYGTAYYYYFHHALARPDNALKKGEFAYMNFRTFELDSGSYMVWYLYQFWKIHNDNELVREMQYAISEFIRICEIEQYHTEKSEYQSHAGRQFPKGIHNIL